MHFQDFPCCNPDEKLVKDQWLQYRCDEEFVCCLQGDADESGLQ